VAVIEEKNLIPIQPAASQKLHCWNSQYNEIKIQREYLPKQDEPMMMTDVYLIFIR
tara:strand:+ start:815 stop:982 length:168 start_codon:yes stop_codon:yes gene_type:complete